LRRYNAAAAREAAAIAAWAARSRPMANSGEEESGGGAGQLSVPAMPLRFTPNSWTPGWGGAGCPYQTQFESAWN